MKRLGAMSSTERVAYLESLREELSKKQQRERAYLDRRAKRGTHTPTDEDYEADQVLESKILAVFDEMLDLEARRKQ